MTICVAAICESGRAVVVAADRMFTASPPISVEFETEEQKIEGLAPLCVALLSGNSGLGTEILNETRRVLGGKQIPTIADVSEIMRNAYATVRSKKASEAVVAPALGLDFLGFSGKGGTLPAYLQPQPQVYQMLTGQMLQFNLGVDIIVTGIDASGAHLSRVTHPGTLFWLDKLGYDAIGSGGIHAVTRLSLGGQTRQRSLIDTLYAVYDAKRAAEVAPGVGKSTDIAVIDGAKGTWPCTKPVLDSLEATRAASTQSLTPDLTRVRGAYEQQRNPAPQPAPQPAPPGPAQSPPVDPGTAGPR